MTRRVVALVTCLVVVGPLTLQAQAPPSTASAGDWRTFTGTWSATGKRQELPTGDGAMAAIERLSGSVVITVGEGVGRGFRGDMIGFDDGRVASVGRWVWTNERGDRIFGELKGEPVQAGRRFVGRITGGTGRFAGITGSLEFTWQSVVTTDEGTVQARAVGLQGRYRPGSGLP